MRFRSTRSLLPSPLSSYSYSQTYWNFFFRFLQSAQSAIPPTMAYLALVESVKFYEIKLWQMQPSNLDIEAKDTIEHAFEKAGCVRKVSSHRYDFGASYTGTITSAIIPNEVLLITSQPQSPREYDELYAIAGHEAVHTKYNHALKAEASLFFSYEFCQAMARNCFLTQRMNRLVTPLSVGVAFFVYSQTSRQLEYQADRKSAEMLGTKKTLCRLFHEAHSDGDPLHPSSASREKRIASFG